MRNIKSMLATGAAVGAAAIGGAALADAATSTSSSSSSGTPAKSAWPSSRGLPAFNGPAPGTGAHEDAEKAVTGNAAAKAKAAAIKAVGGGTAGKMTTNYTGNGYEVTVTKSNDSKVEVHLDSSFSAMQGPTAPAPLTRPSAPAR
jgi:hypothetical protein